MSWGCEQQGGPMRTNTSRKFTLVDAMVLIAAAGLSLVLIRDYLEHRATRYVIETIAQSGIWSVASLWRLSTLVSGMMAPLAVSLSLALWVLRLRQPRPAIHEMFRQPGMVACSATVFATGLFFINISLNLCYYYGNNSTSQDLHRLWMIRLPWNGEVVAVAWLLLWLCGAWCSETSWIDRAGKCLGVYWIISGVCCDYAFRY
jgi:hypothetical protein